MPKPIVEAESPLKDGDRRILVCQNTSCANEGAATILSKFQAEDLPEGYSVCAVGCQGQCSVAPTVRVVPDETWYCRIKPEDVPEICEAVRNDTVVTEKLNPRIHRYSFY